MAGMQFEYDEKGGTFYYFLLSFMALVLFPLTYYCWPRSNKKEDEGKTKRQCQCEPCQMKTQRLKAHNPWNSVKRLLLKLVIILGWVLFCLVVYKASQVEIDYTEFDPYTELEIDRGATDKEIKKQYRKLTLVHHPDKGGDPQKFLKITKAYQALTDEEARENWEKYGNPDGPGATHFGIALPKWIVEKQNSVWVLAVYGLVFMVILPVVVGTWWHRSIKFSAEQILMDTTQLYFYFFHKTPNMILKRVIMILAASMEFEKSHNKEIQERPSDNEEIPPLIKELPHLNEKNKEKPLCYPYSVKARVMLHAHFSRLELPPKSLELDKNYIIKKCPYLINEIINIVAQLVALAHAGRVSHTPRLETMENVMKCSQMVVQGLWDNKSPMLQLPHITEDMLRHFVTRKRNIRTIRQLAQMKDEERRALLRTLNDEEYRNVLHVLSSMPYVEMETQSKGDEELEASLTLPLDADYAESDLNKEPPELLDDDDKSITAGSIVTVTVNLTRQNFEVLFDKEDIPTLNGVEELPVEEGKQEEEEEEEEEKHVEQTETTDSPQRKPKIWEKNKKKKGKGANKKKKAIKQPYIRKAATSMTSGKKEDDGSSLQANGTVAKPKKRKSKPEQDSDDEGIDSEGEVESDAEEGAADNAMVDDDEEDWIKFQQEAKKENPLETKCKETHQVHCPYYPLVKFEWWWLYICDRKNHLLITAPAQVCSLKDHEEVQLKFTAPKKPGIYHYTVCLRSDSYFDFDISHTFKLDVKEERKIESHPQWDISDDEEEKDEADGSESDISSFDESDDD